MTSVDFETPLPRLFPSQLPLLKSAAVEDGNTNRSTKIRQCVAIKFSDRESVSDCDFDKLLDTFCRDSLPVLLSDWKATLRMSS